MTSLSSGSGIRRTNGGGGHVMLFLQVSPGGSVLGAFGWPAPPGGGPGPLRSFLSLLDTLALFEVLSPNFCAHDLLHHAWGEPSSLSIVQPFTKHPAWGKETNMKSRFREKKKQEGHATNIVKTTDDRKQHSERLVYTTDGWWSDLTDADLVSPKTAKTDEAGWLIERLRKHWQIFQDA